MWQANTDKDGYGKIRDDGTYRRAHRVAYELHNGEIPDRAFVLHTCDEPGCVNPEHLYPGSHQDNMDDRMERGSFDPPKEYRFKPGEKSPARKLDSGYVAEIRERYENTDDSQAAIGEEYGVSQKTISNVVRGEYEYH